MRFACVHCFAIDVKDPETAERELGDLQHKINIASGRLAIGYQPGFIKGQPQPVLANPEGDP